MEDGLLEGIQIMSPEELQNEITQTSDSQDVIKTEKGGDVIEDQELGFEIVSVTKEDKESSNEGEEVLEKGESENNAPITGDRKEVIYKTLLKTLYDDGIISLDEQEELDKLEGSADTIKKLIENTIGKKVDEKQNSWKEGLSMDKKKFLEIEDAFTDTQTAIITAQRLEFFEGLTDNTVKSDANLQKQLIAESLRIKGYNESKINEELADIEALGKIEKRALEAYPELLKQTASVVEENRNSIRAAREADTQKQSESFDKLMENIEARESFIDGLPLNKISKDKLKKNIVEPVYTDPKTGKEYNSLMYKQKRNPQEFEMLLNYYDNIGLFNIDKNSNFKPDISKIKAVAKTQAITDLDKVLESNAGGVGKNTTQKGEELQNDIFAVLEKGFGNKR